MEPHLRAFIVPRGKAALNIVRYDARALPSPLSTRLLSRHLYSPHYRDMATYAPRDRPFFLLLYRTTLCATKRAGGVIDIVTNAMATLSTV